MWSMFCFCFVFLRSPRKRDVTSQGVFLFTINLTNLTKYIKSCEVCQKYKPSNTKPSGLLQSSQIIEPGHTLGIDLMGPLTTSKKQNTYLLVIVEYYIKWVEMFPLRDAKTQKIVKILREEIFTHWGVPKFLVSDRGPQFTSSILGNLCKTWGCVQRLTTSYHKQT